MRRGLPSREEFASPNPQIVTILREADRGSVAEVAKKHEISEQRIHLLPGARASARWRPRTSSGCGNSSRRTPASRDRCRPRPRDRGHEGDRRKKMVSAPGRRQQVAHATKWGLSTRRGGLVRCLLGTALRVETAAEGCTGACRHEHPVGPVSSVRLPPHPCPSRTAGAPDQCRLGLAAVARTANVPPVSKKEKAPRPFGARGLNLLGWMMGLEPTTTGITILDSTN